MEKNVVKNILADTDLRQNLIKLKGSMTSTDTLEGPIVEKLCDCLTHEDPKVRKNAALLLGYTKNPLMASVLLNAYKNEEKDFVKDAYLKGMSRYDCKPYIKELQEIQNELMNSEVVDSKHIKAQLKVLNPMIRSYSYHKKKSIRLLHKEVDVILTTLPYYQYTLFEQVKHLRYKPVGQGVLVRTKAIYDLLGLRNYREMIFPLSGCSGLPQDGHLIGKRIASSNLVDVLHRLYDAEGCFYYRLVDQMREKKSAVINDIVKELIEEMPSHLQNVTSDYDIELLIRELRPGTVNVYLKLSSLDNPRFNYRREIISNSMQPYVAATLMEVAKPYMGMHSRVLDPFCGSGVTLIERCMAKPVKFAMGLDIYGEGLEAAKKNAIAANQPIHFVNKDANRFVNNEMFDEIFTDMPTYAQMKDTRALKNLYDNFFKRIHRHVLPEGYVFIYTTEISLVEKNLRLNSDYLTLIEHYDVPRGKTMAYFFIIQVNK